MREALDARDGTELPSSLRALLSLHGPAVPTLTRAIASLPSSTHPALAPVAAGARISLAVGIASVLFAMTLGVSLGLLSGYLGGRLDAFIMRVADVQLSFPAILFGLAIAAVIGTIVLVYTVMASQYESLRDPFIIIFSIPLAAIGVVGALMLTKTPFSMQAYIGVIMLAGIVVSNAILLVDYTNTLRHRDKLSIRQAVETAGRVLREAQQAPHELLGGGGDDDVGRTHRGFLAVVKGTASCGPWRIKRTPWTGLARPPASPP